MLTMLISPRLTSKGRKIGIARYDSTEIDQAKFIDDCINKTEFSYSCGKRVYRQNQQVLKALESGDYEIF